MAFLTHSCLYLTCPALSSSRNSLGEAEFSRAPDTRVGPACSSARLRREVLRCLRNERCFRPRQPGFSLLRVREPEGPGTRLAGPGPAREGPEGWYWGRCGARRVPTPTSVLFRGGGEAKPLVCLGAKPSRCAGLHGRGQDDLEVKQPRPWA